MTDSWDTFMLELDGMVCEKCGITEDDAFISYNENGELLCEDCLFESFVIETNLGQEGTEC